MPYVACPSCGERGKIPPTLVGARIKCRKCGISFNVAGCAAAASGAGGRGERPPRREQRTGGLPSRDWTPPPGPWPATSPRASSELEPEPEHGPAEGDEAAHAFETHQSTGHKEYKVICSRDKMFEGKFDVARLEETFNHFARQGWVVKAMSNPHLKDFGGGTKEEVVVLLER